MSCHSESMISMNIVERFAKSGLKEFHFEFDLNLFVVSPPSHPPGFPWFVPGPRRARRGGNRRRRRAPPRRGGRHRGRSRPPAPQAANIGQDLHNEVRRKRTRTGKKKESVFRLFFVFRNLFAQTESDVCTKAQTNHRIAGIANEVFSLCTSLFPS